MTPEQFNQYAEDSMAAVFGVIAQADDTSDLEKVLCMISSMGIGILRGLRGDEFIEGYLKAATADKSNVIYVETTQVH